MKVRYHSMARPKKKFEPIISLGTNDDKLLVQKSSPLFGLWKSELTLAEFKILDTYLSRIDSHNEEKRSVIFQKGELERILGVKRIRTEELDERLKHLMTTVKIEDTTEKKGFTRIALFEKAVVEQDDNGLWQVEMVCTPSAMKYFFNIENLGYLLYKLRCITLLSSRYTYILFLYLEANKFRKTWTVGLEELKSILNCNNEECYKKFKVFNDRLLKRVKAEMDEKTECRYVYEPVKAGRSVVGIKFTVENLSKGIIKEDKDIQITIDDYLAKKPVWYGALFVNDICEFTEVQLDEIQQILITVPDYKMSKNSAVYGDINLCRYHYIAQKYATLNTRHAEKPIKNRFAYFIKMLKKDAEIVD